MSEKLRFVVADSDLGFCAQLAAAIAADGRAELLGVTPDGFEAERMVRVCHADVLICSLTLSGMDGLSLLDSVLAPGKTRRPLCVAVSSFSYQAAIDAAAQLGAALFVLKPCDAVPLVRTACSLAGRMADTGRTCPRGVGLAAARLFEALGVSVNLRGFACLCAAMELISDDPSRLRAVTKALYPDIARRVGTSAPCVERQIRRAIEDAWARSGRPVFAALLGQDFPARPTSTAFLTAAFVELDRRAAGIQVTGAGSAGF